MMLRRWGHSGGKEENNSEQGKEIKDDSITGACAGLFKGGGNNGRRL